MEKKKITFDSFIRGTIGCLIIVGILFLVSKLSGVLLPFFIAWLIAYFMYPLVRFFQYKLHFKSRILSIFCSIILIAGIIGTGIYLLVPPTIAEFTKIEKLVTTYFNNGFANSTIPRQLSNFIRDNIDMNAVNRMLSEENIMNVIKNTAPKLWTILSQSISFVFSILASFIILLYIIFILLDYESIADGWIKLVPIKYRHFASELTSDLQKGMNSYFRGQALVSLCIGILFSIGFLIIDFPLAICLGLCIGVLSMIPYMHALGLIPTILLAMLKAADTGQNFWVVMAMAMAVFVVVQILEDTIIVPKIMGKITGLNPAIILLSLSIWGSLLGMLGLIIALPLTTVMLSYYKRFIINKEMMREKSEIELTDNQETEDKAEK